MIILVIIIIGFVFYLIYKTNQTPQEVPFEMQYMHLIRTLMNMYNGMLVLHKTDDSIILVKNIDVNVYTINIGRVSNDLIITWTVENSSIGKDTVKWVFNKDGNQSYMVQKINEGIGNWIRETKIKYNIK